MSHCPSSSATDGLGWNQPARKTQRKCPLEPERPQLTMTRPLAGQLLTILLALIVGLGSGVAVANDEFSTFGLGLPVSDPPEWEPFDWQPLTETPFASNVLVSATEPVGGPSLVDPNLPPTLSGSLSTELLQNHEVAFVVPWSYASQATPASGGEQPVPGSSADKATYGKDPEPDRRVNREMFLRTQSPLLKPGTYQVDTGVAYTDFQYEFPSVNGNSVERIDLRRRTIVSPFAFRYGLNSRTQVFCNVPVGVRLSEVASAPISTPTPQDLSTSHFGIGDITIGANYLLKQGCENQPDIVVTLSGGMPTGEKAALTDVFQGGLGTGFASMGAQVLFIHTYDPVVVFYGTGYNYYFAGHLQGTPVQLGSQVIYQLGVGFAANDRVTLSCSYLGSYITPVKINGLSVPDSQQEPIRLRFAVTCLRNHHIVEPFAEVGTTYSSPATRSGITWTF